MRKTTSKLTLFLLVTTLSFSSLFIVINSFGIPSEIEPPFGKAPVIDGIIDVSGGEWNEAVKLHDFIYPNASVPINGLPIELWIMQNNLDLFFSVQFEIHDHHSIIYDDEFITIHISESESNETEAFRDVRIVQFSNISQGTFEYYDYYINESIYLEDDISHGEGAAALEGIRVTYEFSLPVKNQEGGLQDVELQLGNIYAFKISFGLTPLYPDGITLENVFLIDIQFPPVEDNISFWEVINITLTILIFGMVGGFFIYYVFKITILKQKIERIRT